MKCEEFYNLIVEEDEDPRNIDIKESEEHWKVNGPEIKMSDIIKPLKTRKVNIGSKAKPKYIRIWDY